MPSLMSQGLVWKPVLLLLLIFCWDGIGGPLTADLSEESASAIALSGITALSDSPSDQILSPLIRDDGISFNYHLPFGQADAQVWGVHYATEYKILHAGFGSAWMNHPDYNYRDYYLNANLEHEGIVLGYTQHLVHESFSTDDSYLRWLSDLGISSNIDDYGAEIRWLRVASLDAQWHFSALYRFAPESASAVSYVHQPHGDDSFRSCISLAASELLHFAASWQSHPSRFGFGLRLNYGSLALIYAIRTHQELNADHSLEIRFQW